MHAIKVDSEVYGYLQQHARPFTDTENDVLRRLLWPPHGTTPTPIDVSTGTGNAAPAAAPDQAPFESPGDLLPYIEHGLVQAGDELLHVQTRKGITHRGKITATGRISVGEKTFTAVSPALAFCTGSNINGWGQWTHKPSGKKLQELREQIRDLQKA
ncbi:hypothetical protein ACFEMC_23325 (plasmid) [Kineococcus sp. DHX-1]|uniref:restriction system modified-DNA reader domain-containing protein n=1 Tax=Kineococcus sp. DHX-1 TaxID=3349638 RepID=UPI0036D215C9